MRKYENITAIINILKEFDADTVYAVRIAMEKMRASRSERGEVAWKK